VVKRRAAVNLPLDNDTYPCERPAIQRAAFACVRAPQRVSDGGVAGFGKFKTGTPALGAVTHPRAGGSGAPREAGPAGEFARGKTQSVLLRGTVTVCLSEPLFSDVHQFRS
jgi:hypothetical protein